MATINPAFAKLLKQMEALHIKKNADYAVAGNPYSNFEAAALEAGISIDHVFRVMIGIKLARIRELMDKKKRPMNEPLEDSLLDLTMYAALWTAWRMQP